MDMGWILLFVGLLICAGSFLLGKREKKLFEDAVKTKAVVVSYDEYLDMTRSGETQRPMKMYTAVMGYALADGSKMQAREQCGRSRKKYPVGMEIDIEYSRKKPGLFVPVGDNSRKVAFVVMALFGVAVIALSILLLASGGEG